MRDVSVWEHVEAHVPEVGPGLLPGGSVLPDEVPGEPRWVPGYADGVRLAYGRVVPDEQAAQHVAALMAEELRSGTPEAYRKLYDGLVGSDPVTYVNRLLELAPGFEAEPDRIYDLGRRLVTTSKHRAPVKVGIALFGFFEQGRHVPVVLTLGRHDEFTAYAVQALHDGLRDPEPAVWQLAAQATGWGRIAAVTTLARRPHHPEVRNWLLRTGFRNDVAEHLLALPAAVAGGLAARLAEHGLDEELLDAAVDIVRGLLRGGPFGGIGDYEEGAEAATLLVRRLRRRASAPNHALALLEIDRFVRTDRDWHPLTAHGWSPEVRQGLSATCAEILAGPGWTDVVAAGLKSPVDSTFRAAAQVGRFFKIDPVPALLQRLEQEPRDVVHWSLAMASVDEERIHDVVALATSRLPLNDMVGGPSVLLGGEPEYPAHASLHVVLAGLVRWSGQGWPLVRTGLASPLASSRALALRVLHEWGRAAWPLGVDQALRRALQRESDPEVRRHIELLLGSH